MIGVAVPKNVYNNVVERRCFCNGLLDPSECILFLLTLVVDYIFLDHVLHGLNYLHIIRDELPKKVYLAQEGLHSFLDD